MVIDPKRREMFVDLYRLAEYYERPPFVSGDIAGKCCMVCESAGRNVASVPGEVF